MKKSQIALLIYIAVLGCNFYLLPHCIQDTGSGMFMMLCVMPLLSICSAILYSVRHGFSLLLPIVAMLLFSPTIFIYYNATAWVYIIFYGIITLGGSGIGQIFYQKR